MRRRVKQGATCAVLVAALGAAILSLATHGAVRPLSDSLVMRDARRPSLVDRDGRTISVTFDNAWNGDDVVPLHSVPELLRTAFVEAEDRRFFDHQGVDWAARVNAVTQNLRSLRTVRGASTISEQVVRMLHPRRRSVWARWVEGFEAARLERRFDKGEILEFYVNQVPYARQRRGVVQAARDLFDRDLDTLSPREMLTLAVLVRRPSGLDPRRADDAATRRLDAAIGRLAARLQDVGKLTEQEVSAIRTSTLELGEASIAVRAPHFALRVRERLQAVGRGDARVRTTLDGALQHKLEAVLERQISSLAPRGVSDGALLVVDHRSNEILAWVNAGGYSPEREGSRIDAVITPRQPGSTLKPFVYALALEDGWTAATVIDDSPFSGPVGAGMHRYRNYSRSYHGPVRLRTALGSSLNIPAVRAVQAVTPERFHQRLRSLGFDSLARHPSFYGDGLALGNGEVTLLELVQAYATLARGGVREPMRLVAGTTQAAGATRLFSPEVSSIVADILSDAEARSLEFNVGGVLDLPVQTAVKTGTSNDYRDAWTVGFSDRHTVGVWMGNLDRREMDGVSGSIGPAMVLRAAFAELRRHEESKPLGVDRRLGLTRVCRATGLRAGAECPAIDEWFRDGRAPARACAVHGTAHGGATTIPDVMAASAEHVAPPRVTRPTPGLHLAMDPRIPDDLEAFGFEIAWSATAAHVEWYVDDRLIGATAETRYPWPLERGTHKVAARVWARESEHPVATPPVQFHVK